MAAKYIRSICVYEDVRKSLNECTFRLSRTFCFPYSGNQSEIRFISFCGSMWVWHLHVNEREWVSLSSERNESVALRKTTLSKIGFTEKINFIHIQIRDYFFFESTSNSLIIRAEVWRYEIGLRMLEASKFECFWYIYSKIDILRWAGHKKDKYSFMYLNWKKARFVRSKLN